MSASRAVFADALLQDVDGVVEIEVVFLVDAWRTGRRARFFSISYLRSKDWVAARLRTKVPVAGDDGGGTAVVGAVSRCRFVAVGPAMMRPPDSLSPGAPPPELNANTGPATTAAHTAMRGQAWAERRYAPRTVRRGDRGGRRLVFPGGMAWSR